MLYKLIVKKGLVVGMLVLFIGSSIVSGIIGESKKNNDASVTFEQLSISNKDCDASNYTLYPARDFTLTFGMFNRRYEVNEKRVIDTLPYPASGCYVGDWSVTEVVSTESTGTSRCSSLAVDNSGVVHVAWEDWTNYQECGSDRDIFYNYKPAGGNWMVTEVVSTESTSDSEYPSLAVDNSGVVHVAWHDWTDYGGSGDDTDIFYKYKSAGGVWSSTEVVSTESTHLSMRPSLAVDNSGVVHVAWEDFTDYGGSGGGWDIFYNYKPAGGNWMVTEVVSTESTSYSFRPSLAVDNSGVVHVAWHDWTDYGGSGDDTDIFYKYKSAGGVWSSTEVVSTESTSVSCYPSLAVDSSGVVHVAWEDWTNYQECGSDRDIFYNYKPAGGNWMVTEVVSTESTSDSEYPSLAVDYSGVVHVTWYDNTAYGGSGSDSDIFYKYKTPDDGWSVTGVVSTESTGTSWCSSLAVDNSGVVHVAWEDFTDYGGSGGDRDIFYKYRKPNLPPIFGTPSPINGSINRPLNFTWSIPISDPEGDLFSWTIECNNGQTNGGTNESNGTKSLSLSGLLYNTTYTVWVNATDPEGSDKYIRAWYYFRTTPPPRLDIADIKGGFNIRAVIKNIGDVTINDIHWSITVVGGLQGRINKTESGRIPLLYADGDWTTVSIGQVLWGFGPITITVKANVSGANVQSTKSGFILLCFTFIK